MGTQTIMLKTKQIIESWLVSFRGKFKSSLKHSMGAIPYFELRIYDSGQLVQKNQLSLTGDYRHYSEIFALQGQPILVSWSRRLRKEQLFFFVASPKSSATPR